MISAVRVAHIVAVCCCVPVFPSDFFQRTGGSIRHTRRRAKADLPAMLASDGAHQMERIVLDVFSESCQVPGVVGLHLRLPSSPRGSDLCRRRALRSGEFRDWNGREALLHGRKIRSLRSPLQVGLHSLVLSLDDAKRLIRKSLGYFANLPLDQLLESSLRLAQLRVFVLEEFLQFPTPFVLQRRPLLRQFLSPDGTRIFSSELQVNLGNAMCISSGD